MATTIRDVARAANVSVATVSRALNGQGSVSEAARTRIVEAANALGYVPHGVARSLITRRTQTIGVLLPDLHGEFFSELIRGIDQAARERGFHVLVSSSHGDGRETAMALAAMRGRVDGVLVMSPHVDEGVLARALPAGLPAVLMNTPMPEAPHSAIMIDNRAGAYAMVAHLVTCGYRRIAHVLGPTGNHDAQERERGYREALAQLLPEATPICIPGDFTEASGRRAGEAILAMPQPPDAVFASNDMMAIGCLFAFADAGMAVPRDIALAGFDDVPIARYVTPALTTVRVRIADLGQRAFEQLASALAAGAPAAPTTQTLPTELVVRQSCTHAAGRAESQSAAGDARVIADTA